jgi:hypothetical protein
MHPAEFLTDLATADFYCQAAAFFACRINPADMDARGTGF